MRTITPFGFASLLARHQPLDLIDVRPREEFDRLHIRGARSIPLSEFSAAAILKHRSLPQTEPLFVICGDHLKASLAAGMLRAAGCVRPVIVEGGMNLWEIQGLPAVHPWSSRMRALLDRSRAVREPVLICLRASWSYVLHLIERLVHAPAENAWWCRCKFPPREA
jgi:rhodanese-related sulfurtransferase